MASSASPLRQRRAFGSETWPHRAPSHPSLEASRPLQRLHFHPTLSVDVERIKSASAPEICFGPFRLLPRQQLLLREDVPVPAAVIPYSIIKEVNPDHAKGSATGAMNFLVFVMTALAASAIGWWMQELAGGAALTLDVFVTAGSVYVAAIVVAVILTLFLEETGSAVRKAH